MHPEPAVQRLRILGVPVDIIDLPTAVTEIVAMAGKGASQMVFVREVASLMLSTKHADLQKLHDEAALVVPDGMPLVWIARLRGFQQVGRVAGADLMDAVCEASRGNGQSHFFYGGGPGVAEKVAAAMQRRHPGIVVAGTFTPPMRDVGPNFDFDAACVTEVGAIRATQPHFIWVGISSPKQERWMARATEHIDGAVMFGVGAAFDFHAGRISRAPKWMQTSGLEWLHRLLSEPRRLWRRYLVLAPTFAAKVAVELATRSWSR